MESSKWILPKGQSYPLKPSELEQALSAADLGLPVKYTRWTRGDSVFAATYYPDGRIIDRPEHIWVYCIAVPVAESQRIRAYLTTIAVPRMLAWAKNIESLDRKSPVRREVQRLSFSFDDAVSWSAQADHPRLSS